MAEDNRRELEPRYYRAVGATGPQSENAYPALARRKESAATDSVLLNAIKNVEKQTKSHLSRINQLKQKIKQQKNKLLIPRKA